MSMPTTVSNLRHICTLTHLASCNRSLKLANALRCHGPIFNDVACADIGINTLIDFAFVLNTVKAA